MNSIVDDVAGFMEDNSMRLSRSSTRQVCGAEQGRLFSMPADAGTRGNKGQAEPRSSRMVADRVGRVLGGVVGEAMLIACCLLLCLVE